MILLPASIYLPPQKKGYQLPLHTFFLYLEAFVQRFMKVILSSIYTLPL